MEELDYHFCEKKQYHALYSLCFQYIVLHKLKINYDVKKGYKDLCLKCNKNFKRIYNEGSTLLCSSCYDVKNDEYGICVNCNCDAKLENNRCFLCNEIEEVKEGIRDHIEIPNNEILCKGCFCERKSIEKRKIDDNSLEYLCKYCYESNNLTFKDVRFQDIDSDLYYENCINKNYWCIIELSKQLMMLHYMKKIINRQLGYKILCDNCGCCPLRISEQKEKYLCSKCEVKEANYYGKCEICKCEDYLQNNRCFICTDIENVNEGMLDFINTDENSSKCMNCHIEKGSTRYVRCGLTYINLCKYCG